MGDGECRLTGKGGKGIWYSVCIVEVWDRGEGYNNTVGPGAGAETEVT